MPCGAVYQLGRSDLRDTTRTRQVYSLKAKYKDYKPVQVVVDSAAVECVANKGIIEDLRGPNAGPIKKGAAAAAGVSYVTADGGEVPNEGEQDVNMMTKEGHMCGMTWQVADIQKPLLAVTALTKTGHEVRFRQSDGEIVHTATGRTIKFQRKGGLYVLTLWMKTRDEGEQGFQRQGK